MKKGIIIVALVGMYGGLFAQKVKNTAPVAAPSAGKNYTEFLKPLKFRSIGPFRGGRSVTACGVPGQPAVYYMGTTGGGVWKTEDAGTSWQNISDGFFTTGSVGAVAVAASDVNVVYVGMGEHAPRGVMTSHGDGVYKSTDAGKTWKHIGLRETRHISWIRIHPTNADVVWVAAQGALYGPSAERGVFKTTDGGQTWKKVLYVDENTGCADLDVDVSNPRVLYAAMWDHWRKPWEVKSGGKGSGLYKSVDGGETWSPVTNGIPAKLGKMSVSVSRANPGKVFALIESDTQEELGGLFVSNNAGESFSRVSKDHRLTQRAWYYVEVFADPVDENTVYVLNSPGLKSADGGKTWTNIRGTHGDYHQLWINPANNKNMVVANDGGAAVTFNGGKTWSSQSNQPTAQFYRISVDNLFPYHIYAGQQDNTSVKVLSRSLSGYSLSEKDWWYSAGGESAFLAFDPNNPTVVAGGSYQGTIEWLDTESREGKNMMIAPIQYQALQPKQMKYRFNWNAPIIHSQHEKGAFYHAGNKVFKTTDKGKTWAVVSPDLTRNDTLKQGMSGLPYTNEGAGGENYSTIAYLTESPHEAGVMYAGSDDGLVHITRDAGKTWQNITPPGLPETLINCIEVSPHDKATLYIATTRYKFNDHTPGLYKSTDYGKTWTTINNGIAAHAFTRCIREDNGVKGLLFAGTEVGLYLSADGGASWQPQQMGLPITPVTDLKVHGGNLIAATMGRSFWVLDDLAQLRQLANWADTGKMTLYQPADAYRLSGGSMLDGDMEPQGTVASAFAGVNAPTGVVFYYQLPNQKDTATLYLDIKNSDGEPVRSYSSKADANFESYPGGPGSEALLPASGGMHRFVWDQRYPTLIGVPRVFIEGSYAGGRVAPGRYTATLRRGTQQQQVSFTIKPHPGLSYPAADYAEQQQWQRKIEADFNEIHQTVLEGRKIRQQLELFAKVATANATAQALGKEAKALADKLLAWENEVVQNKAESNDDIINYVNKISADYIFLKGELDTNIPYVTNGVKEQYAALKAQWQGYKAAYHKLVHDELGSFNRQCTQQQIQQILLPQ
ncbi:MAG: hypothetical protein MUF24_06535 [Chitinophagaceae bacterium]|nr:hypothetical protein [Chitinophagaceae bacterium]